MEFVGDTMRLKETRRNSLHNRWDWEGNHSNINKVLYFKRQWKSSIKIWSTDIARQKNSIVWPTCSRIRPH